jgi:hypothetical protein
MLLKEDPGLTDKKHRMVRDNMLQMDVFRNIWDYIS